MDTHTHIVIHTHRTTTVTLAAHARRGLTRTINITVESPTVKSREFICNMTSLLDSLEMHGWCMSAIARSTDAFVNNY